ncbi:MAG: pentapeptide repeat-containing protein [Candidatus Heimdallarchaeota archaeon]
MIIQTIYGEFLHKGKGDITESFLSLLNYVSHIRLADLKGIILKLNLNGYEFEKCTFKDCNFPESFVRKTVFKNCTFCDCTFTNSRFVDTALCHCDFWNCVFDDACFKNCNFNFSTLKDCSVIGTKFPGSKLIYLKKINTTFTIKQLKGTDIEKKAIRNLKSKKQKPYQNFLIERKFFEKLKALAKHKKIKVLPMIKKMIDEKYFEYQA